MIYNSDIKVDVTTRIYVFRVIDSEAIRFNFGMASAATESMEHPVHLQRCSTRDG